MKTRFASLAVRAGLLALAWALTLGAAQEKGDKTEGITREQADQILNELKGIRQLLEKMQPATASLNAPPASPRVRVSGEGYSLGRSDAPLTLVEFADYQCPFCTQFHSRTFPELRKNYIDTGKLRFIIRDLPLDFHNNALQAAQAARCSGEQGKFWEMGDLLSSHAIDLDPEAIQTYGQQVGLDMQRFRACLDQKVFLPQITKDIAEAKSLGITGTPSFVLGKPGKDSIEGVVLVGTMPYSALDVRLRQLLVNTQ